MAKEAPAQPQETATEPQGEEIKDAEVKEEGEQK